MIHVHSPAWPTSSLLLLESFSSQPLMGSSSSKTTTTVVVPPKPWYLEFDEGVRKMMGSPDGALFVTGLDVATLPYAFLAGAYMGVGIGLWRGQKDLKRPMRGMGVLLVGLTLAVPAYVRVGYLPFLFIGPRGFAWSFFTGSVIGAGVRMLRLPTLPPPVPDGEANNLARNRHDRARAIDEVDGLVEGSFAAGIIASGLYLALPGPVRVLMMYS